MDITLQVMEHPPSHDLSYDPVKQRQRYVKGDIVCVYNRKDCPEPPTEGTRMVFIHVTDAPCSSMAKAKNLISMNFDTGGGRRVKTEKRKWNITKLPTAAKKTLRNYREITMEWAKAKGYIKNKISGLLIVDGDLL